MSRVSRYSKADVLNLVVRVVAVVGLAAVCFRVVLGLLERIGLAQWSSAFWPTPYLIGGVLGQVLISTISRLPFDGYGLDSNARGRLAMMPVMGAVAGAGCSILASLVLLDRNLAGPHQSPSTMLLIGGITTLSGIVFTIAEARRLLLVGHSARDAG